ncbi:MAG: PucR family transcriptional regulator ligand-binding domain-containing protein, partial [Solirubrobacteraceae bacterium]
MADRPRPYRPRSKLDVTATAEQHASPGVVWGTMGITVGELIDIPHLRTRLHAGVSGRDNPITWAHSCEVPNPWNWLEAGDLLMTNG